MSGDRLRVEVVRFGLLITVTIALVSVAVRISHHDGAPRHGHHGSASLAGSSHGPTPGGTRSSGSASHPPGSSTGAPTPTGGTGGSQAGGSGSSGGTSGDSGAAGSGSGAASSGTSGDSSTGGSSTGSSGVAVGPPPQLPRTGSSGDVRLAGLALAMIAGGYLSVIGSRTPRRRTR